MVFIIHEDLCIKMSQSPFVPRRGDEVRFMRDDRHCVAIVDQVIHMLDQSQVHIVVRDLEER